MTEQRYVRHSATMQLYRSFQLYLRGAQLLFNAPQCCFASDLPPSAYFKQARCLLTGGTLAWISICGYRAIVQLIDVPMPFFTAVLYVNEVVLCVCITVQTMIRGYGEAARYSQFLERIVTVASAMPSTEWTEVLQYLRRRLHRLGTVFILTFSAALLLDYLHFGDIYDTLFTLGAYLLPNVLASMALAQYYAASVLIYKLQQAVNRQVRIAAEKHRTEQLEAIKHHYLQLDHCVQLLTGSFEVLIVTNVFAGINVTSLQLLEIYQYLQVNEVNTIYIAYDMLWISLQLCMLLIVLYPSQKIKREQIHFGTILFELPKSPQETVGVDQQIAHLRALALDRKKMVTKACGVLKLELSSLSSIFVALLSFMIILIQFDSDKLNQYNGAVTALDSVYGAN